MSDDELRQQFEKISGQVEKIEGRLDGQLEKIYGQFEKIEGRLDGQLDKIYGKFEKIDAQFEKIDGKFEKIDGQFEKIDGQFEKINARFEQQTEEMRQIETNLLTAFHNWARPMEIRHRNTANSVSGYDERLSMIEERLGKLETGRGK